MPQMSNFDLSAQSTHSHGVQTGRAVLPLADFASAFAVWSGSVGRLRMGGRHLLDKVRKNGVLEARSCLPQEKRLCRELNMRASPRLRRRSMTGDAHPLIHRAFSGEVDTGSPNENATN